MIKFTKLSKECVCILLYKFLKHSYNNFINHDAIMYKMNH